MSEECDNCAAKGQGGPFCQSCAYYGNTNSSTEDQYSSGKNEVVMSIMTSVSLFGGLILSGVLFWKLKEWGVIDIFSLFEKMGLWGLGLIFLCFLIIPIIFCIVGFIILEKIGWA